MGTILIVDDEAIFRDLLAESLGRAGHNTICAADASTALAATRQCHPDLIILDMLEPHCEAITFLGLLRKECASTEVILLTGPCGRREIEMAARYGIKDCLLKTRATLAVLYGRIDKHLTSQIANGNPTAIPSSSVPASPQHGSASKPPAAKNVALAAIRQDLPQLLTRDQSVARAEKAMEARTLSGIVAQVVSLAASARGDLEQLAGLISRDPMLSARVLQTANSAAYASQRGVVTTIADAVRQIGCSTVRNIAATFGVFDTMPPTESDGFNPLRCWQHSFAVAQLCLHLAEARGQRESETGIAYLIGLCHDLGEVLFHTHFATEMRKISEVQEQTGRPRIEIERAMLGLSHADLVGLILNQIGLPQSIRDPIEAFHGASGAGAQATDLAKMLRLADSYANGLLLASSPDSAVTMFTDAECKAVTGKETPKVPDADEFRSRVLMITGTLARLSPSDDATLMKPLYEQCTKKIFLAKDRQLSRFDPLTAALGSLAQTRIDDHLPDASELSDCAALVTAARSDTTSGFTPLAARAAAKFKSDSLPTLSLVAKIEEATNTDADIVTTPTTLRQLVEFLAAA